MDEATNRLTGATYDASGNVTGFTLLGETYQYTYDPLNMMKHLQSNTDQARVFVYDADDERIMTFDCPAGDCVAHDAQITATIRGLDGKVLRKYNLVFGESWLWQRDYVYRGGLLLASVEPSGSGGESTVHFHLDHLGTPRQITDETANEVAFHSYYPFGGEATDASQDERKLKFTGHERDGNGSAGAGMLDYMHARYCAPGLGRFLSIDPINGSPIKPQTWNRYSYVTNQPMMLTDPTGKVTAAGLAEGAQEFIFDLENQIDFLTEGNVLGILTNTAVGSVADLTVGLLDVFTVGAATGNAIGSGTSGLGLAKAVGGDMLRLATLAGGAAGATRVVGKRIFSVPRGKPGIHMGKQGKHMPSHNNYLRGRSILSEDPGRLADFAGKGQQVGRVRVGLPGSRERVDFGRVIGDYVRDGVATPTTKGIVHYAKDGIHIVPAAP